MTRRVWVSRRTFEGLQRKERQYPETPADLAAFEKAVAKRRRKAEKRNASARRQHKG